MAPFINGVGRRDFRSRDLHTTLNMRNLLWLHCIQKGSQFKFQQKCYSIHKHCPLVTPIVSVSSSGYIINVIGPYFSGGKDNEPQILNHIIQNGTEECHNG